MVKELVKKETRSEGCLVSARSLAKFNLPYDNHWGEPPRIAVIYALGVCAMDEGITARRLVKDVEAALDDSRVKAIVLRVDSPGGDAMASDYIAEAMKKAKGKKAYYCLARICCSIRRVLAFDVRRHDCCRTRHDYRLHRCHRRMVLQQRE
jgi:ClpP class serine protease